MVSFSQSLQTLCGVEVSRDALICILSRVSVIGAGPPVLDEFSVHNKWEERWSLCLLSFKEINRLLNRASPTKRADIWTKETQQSANLSPESLTAPVIQFRLCLEWRNSRNFKLKDWNTSVLYRANVSQCGTGVTWKAKYLKMICLLDFFFMLFSTSDPVRQ